MTGGAWVTFLIGPPGAVADAARQLRGAAEDLGIGAKTAAGYGYFTVTVKAAAAAGAAARVAAGE